MDFRFAFSNELELQVVEDYDFDYVLILETDVLRINNFLFLSDLFKLFVTFFFAVYMKFDHTLPKTYITL